MWWIQHIRHFLHLILFTALILLVQINVGTFGIFENPANRINPVKEYGILLTIWLYFIRLLVLLSIPQVVFNFSGWVFYNGFPDKVKLKVSPLFAPFLCFRVVTRGDYPKLVEENVHRNLNTCLEVGLHNFLIEIVTDKPIGLQKHGQIREIVVPSSYKTKKGALYKARALQYCWEDDVSILSSDDWIVHLDEETILTSNAVIGILNFINDGSNACGQGVITYANDKVVNWITTLVDCPRVAMDWGMLRFQFRFFKKPIFSWKGSFCVIKSQVEKEISFDHGFEGSIAEDCFFAMAANAQGYTFDFIDGEMWEKSPFTVLDMIYQRKRWMQGMFLTLSSSNVPKRIKIGLFFLVYCWMLMPLSTTNLVFAFTHPVPTWGCLDALCGFICSVYLYLYVFGAIKSVSLTKYGLWKSIGFVLASIACIPFAIIIENIAAIWAIFGQKKGFHIVLKELKSTTPQMIV